MPSNDDDGYVEFVRAASGRLFRTAYAVSGDYQLAEDAVQAALASAYSRWRKVSAADNPEAYVQRMVLNQLLSWRRRAWTRHEVPSADPPVQHSPVPVESAYGDQDEVWRALATLPPRQRAVVVLRYVEDLSVAETAAALGVRDGTVKSQSSAAMSRLRDRLGTVERASEGGSR
jgi:RNA polymerase sigma-70 factor (sigma-E family)